ncbi:Glutathione transport system permease protein gsiD [Anaerobiospirillum thomasii]|uniref:ABC transporter permease n=1 Tax=Anaerobiospirillum thomasii TaxID=179995 RepID=UPI000D86CEB0|nr:ABC transporter permease [Anaerobiospirillum thomasii]SPT72063.1 Glutathione transport system permease protein gsiD [Anaerobiospirillum thomasii]
MTDVTLTPKQSRFADMASAIASNKAALTGLIFILLLAATAIVIAATQAMGLQILPYDPNLANMEKAFIAPNAEHWFGTDQLGRDIFSRVLDGTKVSLSVGLSAVAISLTLGTILGAMGGYYGGRLDNIIMRMMDVVLSVPSILLAIAFMAALGRGLDKAVLAIGLVSIPEYARIARSCVISVKANDYIQAAIVTGDTNLRIIFRHILPNITSPIVVRATLGISTAVLDTAALGFLGLGVQPPFAEWGDMLARSRSFIFSAPHTLIFPGLAITLTVLAFNLFGDGLRDALDPRSRKR